VIRLLAKVQPVLAVTSEPTDAAVLVDGKEVGRTPLMYRQVKRGETYEVAVRKRGHWAAPRRLEVDRFGAIDLPFVMKESALPPGLDGQVVVPTGAKDQYGNPVRRGTDPATGWPLEVWLPVSGEVRRLVFFKRKMAGHIEFVLIPAGEFTMGSDGGASDEKPVHHVRLTESYYLAKYEITQGQWESVMGSNPSRFKGANNPVEQVSWEDCQKFVNRLGSGFRLPTEAEWEYACRAGSTMAYCFGPGSSDVSEYAWYGHNSGGKTRPVGQKKPNAWGLYDLHGNVWEWCQDWYGEYSTGSVTDPTGPTGGSSRVFRGGGWGITAGRCRSAFRSYYSPDSRYDDLGCRLVLRSSP